MKNVFTLLILLVAVTLVRAQTTVPQLELEDFSEGFNKPLAIENCGDSRLFIVEQPGKIWIVDEDGNKSPEPFLDITTRVKYDGAEQGLLGLAFHPDYAVNGFFYVNYITLEGNTRIARFQVSANDPNRANPSTQKTILKVKQPFANHNGGCLRFGPDGYLYIGLGDGGDAGDPFENAQDPGQLLGKMLRIDINTGDPYAIPPTNPFVNVAGYQPEIWALGLRNPFRWSFDRLTGDLWIGDVGQDKWEEINYQSVSSTGGENYGWDCK
ncbi:MAG TPA: PQQ-dependent sugar dehydrogenase [Chitinophagales bacterium]|nr:PQQ-dependent sugar dehydrogenase [Chitinophagales bacterium]